MILILVVVDNGLVRRLRKCKRKAGSTVLILVVVDNGLVHLLMQRVVSTSTCLNPCCSGR